MDIAYAYRMQYDIPLGKGKKEREVEGDILHAMNNLWILENRVHGRQKLKLPNTTIYKM